MYFNFFFLLTVVAAVLGTVMAVMYNNLNSLIQETMAQYDEDKGNGSRLDVY